MNPRTQIRHAKLVDRFTKIQTKILTVYNGVLKDEINLSSGEFFFEDLDDYLDDKIYHKFGIYDAAKSR